MSIRKRGSVSIRVDASMLIFKCSFYTDYDDKDEYDYGQFKQ